ncbi:hypothetical protein XA68_17835 [Ophiocordyceps unilateralis]|uniref:Uncharacterized protein n=1 Tax=Ophiocordyceps unilateralis TaxID=268505 RepID=A0A2A9PK28_OPHUN|nr:hypothetical protein XA68_17835 [Ophiocordyceps unilateralis]
MDPFSPLPPPRHVMRQSGIVIVVPDLGWAKVFGSWPSPFFPPLSQAPNANAPVQARLGRHSYMASRCRWQIGPDDSVEREATGVILTLGPHHCHPSIHHFTRRGRLQRRLLVYSYIQQPRPPCSSFHFLFPPPPPPPSPSSSSSSFLFSKQPRLSTLLVAYLPPDLTSPARWPLKRRASCRAAERMADGSKTPAHRRQCRLVPNRRVADCLLHAIARNKHQPRRGPTPDIRPCFSESRGWIDAPIVAYTARAVPFPPS